MENGSGYFIKARRPPSDANVVGEKWINDEGEVKRLRPPSIA
jgi:hypothetical protein